MPSKCAPLSCPLRTARTLTAGVLGGDVPRLPGRALLPRPSRRNGRCQGVQVPTASYYQLLCCFHVPFIVLSCNISCVSFRVLGACSPGKCDAGTLAESKAVVTTLGKLFGKGGGQAAELKDLQRRGAVLLR